MEQIVENKLKFDFNLYRYLIRLVYKVVHILVNSTNENKPLFIQMTSCKTKQGIVKTGKKIH